MRGGGRLAASTSSTSLHRDTEMVELIGSGAGVSDDDDWVGEPPEGRHTRERRTPATGRNQWKGSRDHRRRSILLLILVVVLIVLLG